MWLPISSAPKDGTQVLMVQGDLFSVGHYESHQDFSFKPWCIDGFWQETTEFNTHWMPLPSPPTEQQPLAEEG